MVPEIVCHANVTAYHLLPTSVTVSAAYLDTSSLKLSVKSSCKAVPCDGYSSSINVKKLKSEPSEQDSKSEMHFGMS